jgi:cyclophilin family peptidyl-prolyl cis-trans isomerase
LAAVAVAVVCGVPLAAGAATRVLMDTSLGLINIELYDQTVIPETYDNFLRYVDGGDYDNTIIHRSDTTSQYSVIQGGTYKSLLPSPSAIATKDPIVNEWNAARPNRRGTIAMARTSALNSATSGWFFNLVNNTAFDDDANKNIYAVFGDVVSGMDVVDAIGALTAYPLGPTLTPPLVNGTYDPAERNGNFVYVFRACRNDGDFDGACTKDEDGADGNADGTADRDGNMDGTDDSLQNNVASVLNPKLNKIVTFDASPKSDPNIDPNMLLDTARAGSGDAQTLLLRFPLTSNKLVSFNQGGYTIAMTGTMNPAGETVTIYDRADARPNAYYWYDTTTDPANPSWRPFILDGTGRGADITPGNLILLHLKDNEPGDNDPAVGKIKHIGAPAREFPRPEITAGVRVETPFGAFNIGLYRGVAQATVDNFLDYVARTAYDGTFFHFSNRDTVLRGGGYSSLDPVLTPINPAQALTTNESDPARPNVRGTISMWWQDQGGPNSATSEWSINVKDNPGFDKAASQGYSVFGEVLEPGWDVVKAISDLGTYAAVGATAPPLLDGSYISLRGNANYVNVYRVCRNDDLDAVCTADEDLAPNGGDGNGDGPLDSTQKNVTSLLNPELNRTVTLEAGPAVRLDDAWIRKSSDATVFFDQQTFIPPAGTVTRISEGMYGFAITGTMNPAGETVTILNRATARPNRYYVGVTETGRWEDFAFDPVTGTGAEIFDNRIVLHFVDNGRGDDDSAVGKIAHVGAPATESPLPPPAANDNKNSWGCAIGNASRRMSNTADWGIVAVFLAFVFVRTRGRRSGTRALA